MSNPPSPTKTIEWKMTDKEFQLT